MHEQFRSKHLSELVASGVAGEGSARSGLLLLKRYRVSLLVSFQFIRNILTFFNSTSKGGSLQDDIDSGVAIPSDVLVRTLLGVCDGLAVFHHHSPPYAYRDLKPSNVLFDDDGVAVLADLGSVAVARPDLSSRRQVPFSVERICICINSGF